VADSSKHRDLGLFLMRVGMGVMFMTHGVPKLLGGPERWEKLGGAMRHLGVEFAPTFWGFMAGLAEAGGGLCLALGVAFRPACAAMFFTMFVAALKHLMEGDGFGKASHAIEAGVVFFALLLIGPGAWKLALVKSGDKAPRKDR
jgi:putative oxidoreductase